MAGLAPPTWWTWVWVNCRSWWWSGGPGVLWLMGLQRVGHNWATELTDWLKVAIVQDNAVRFNLLHAFVLNKLNLFRWSFRVIFVMICLSFCVESLCCCRTVDKESDFLLLWWYPSSYECLMNEVVNGNGSTWSSHIASPGIEPLCVRWGRNNLGLPIIFHFG